MSILRGDAGSSWSLPGSVDALAAAARQAGRPGAVWIAGLAYQFVVLGWSFGSVVAGPLLKNSVIEVGQLSSLSLRPIHGMEKLITWIQEVGPGAALVSAPLVLVSFRLAGGLARISPSARWAEDDRRSPSIRRTWRAGRGTTLSGVGLWLLFVLMMFAATLLFAGPTHLLLSVVKIEALNPITAIVSGVAGGLLLVYSFLLSILFQLGLQSLVQNRRGSGSALQHAWRIASNDPLATARATAVDAVLYFTVLVLLLGTLLVQKALGIPEVLLLIPYLGLLGFGGCARAAFWSRAYAALGGLSTLQPSMPGEDDE